MASPASSHPEPDELISVATAAEMLGDSEAFVLELISSGTLTPEARSAPPLIRRSDARAYQQERRRLGTVLSRMQQLVDDTPGGWDYGAEEYGPPRA